MRTRTISTTVAAAVLLAGVTGCSGDALTTPDVSEDAGETVLLSVEPEAGSAGVGVDTVITVAFSHPMNPAMSGYADVHEGELAGPEIRGTWEWDENDTVLRFTPSEPLAPATDYVVHLGAGMMDAEGEHVNMEEHGTQMGGEWVTDGMMMTDGDMGTGMSGRMDPSEHMGGSWDHPSNGSHGMAFTFTTAG